MRLRLCIILVVLHTGLKVNVMCITLQEAAFVGEESKMKTTKMKMIIR